VAGLEAWLGVLVTIASGLFVKLSLSFVFPTSRLQLGMPALCAIRFENSANVGTLIYARGMHGVYHRVERCSLRNTSGVVEIYDF